MLRSRDPDPDLDLDLPTVTVFEEKEGVPVGEVVWNPDTQGFQGGCPGEGPPFFFSIRGVGS